MGDALEKLATPGGEAAGAVALGDRLWARGNDHLLPARSNVVVHAEKITGTQTHLAQLEENTILHDHLPLCLDI